MAIVRTGTAQANNGPSATSLTVSLTISAGADQFAVATGYATGSSAPTSIVRNGQSFTAISTGDLAGAYNFLYYLVAPTVGTYNAVLTLSSAGYNNMAITAYSDIDQTTPYYGYAKFLTAASNPNTIAATGTSVDDWFHASSTGNRDSTAGTNLTLANNGITVDQFDSNGTIGSTSSRNYVVDITSPFANANYVYYLFLKKTGTPPPSQNSNFLMYM